jgi:hypothetical protein
MLVLLQEDMSNLKMNLALLSVLIIQKPNNGQVLPAKFTDFFCDDKKLSSSVLQRRYLKKYGDLICPFKVKVIF